MRKQLSKHGSEIAFLKKLKLQLEASALSASSPAVRDIEKGITSLQSGDASESIQESEDAPDATGMET